MKFTEKNIGQRVQLKRNVGFDFQADDVGTIKGVDSPHYIVHFDIARNGWRSLSLGIPNLHGLYVQPKDLRKVQE